MTVWNRDDAEAYLLRRINYETQPAAERTDSFRLRSMVELVERLGHPERCAPIVHVAGTKGKGSTAAMTAAVLQEAGFRVGLYTSPHLQQIEERIAVDGHEISGDEFASAVAEVVAATERIDAEIESGTWDGNPPTYFDMLTAAAWCAFRTRTVDIMVIEVGLGGRLDSTNVATPVLSIITSISLDHTRQLGDTTALIATEKAGIIKPGVPVVSGVFDLSAAEVIAETCRRLNCRLLRSGHEFQFSRTKSSLDRVESSTDSDAAASHERIESQNDDGASRFTPLTFDWSGWLSAATISDCSAEPQYHFRALQAPFVGEHQIANAALAIAASLIVTDSRGGLDESVLRRGLRRARLPARIERLIETPCVVVDVAHNVAAIEALLRTLAPERWPGRRSAVIAISDDKDVEGIAARLAGHFDRFVATRFLHNPRAVDPERLARALLQAENHVRAPGSAPGSLKLRHFPEVTAIADPLQAWELVWNQARPDDLICLTGSTFLVAELRPSVEATGRRQEGHFSRPAAIEEP